MSDAYVKPEGCTCDGAQLSEARGLLADLVSDDECDYDHHGYCQAHLWFTDDEVCVNKRAKTYLADKEAR